MAQTKATPVKKKASNENIEGFFDNDNISSFGKDFRKSFFGNQNQPFLYPNDLFASSLNIGSTFQEASLKLMERPDEFLKSTEKLMRDNLQLLQYSFARLQEGVEEVKPVVEPSKQDRRFRDPLWEEHPAFDFIKQSYLLFANWAESLSEITPDLDKATKMKLRFYSRQLVDALSPSNFPFANPTVFKKVVETQGENLFKGYTRLLEDMNQGGNFANIENTDRYAFQIGQDIAVTSGKVVFQNDLMQLIQYTPTTDKVFKTPLLIIPAWINKYYILDLRQDNSFVKWLLDQGHTVFMVSWVNPGKKQLNVSFDDYLKKGALKAVQVAQEVTGEKKINLIGYCLGGILATVMLGYLQKEASKSLNTLSLLVSPLDYSQAGELLLFTDKHFYNLICQSMEERGILDGSIMGATFNMLRANDLIWSAFVNNYLLANEPPQFDMLFWNADVTNMPAEMFKTYIKEFFQNNNLLRPGAMKMLGRPIDVSQANVPIFMLGTHEDHIAPWFSIYKAVKSFQGPVNFVLSGSGHVAGVINPPSKHKYGYWINSKLPKDPNDWFGNAEFNPGSWWTEWENWIETKMKDQVDSSTRQPGTDKYKPIEDAPGSYVRVRAEEALKD